MKRIVLLVVAFAVASMAAQTVSHFVLAAEHYATIAHLREAPILPLGVLAMLVQGTLLALLFERLWRRPVRVGEAVVFAWSAGLFLVSYIALVEPAKYVVPSVSSWAGVEFAAGFVQFSLYGVLLWLTRGFARAGAPVPA